VADRFATFLQTYCPEFANVEILLNGVFLAPEDKETRGVTFLYVNKNPVIPSRPGRDDSNFDNFWDQGQTFWAGFQRDNLTLRIVILVNLASVISDTQMYVTLLHEWIAHGRHWQGVIDAFRRNNMHAVADVRVNDEPVNASPASPDNQRQYAEHIAYSQLTDKELKDWVNTALEGIEQKMRTRVLNALKKDRNDERQGNGDSD